VDNADKLGLSASQARMLSRLLIGPEFRNHQGGEGQTVSLLGAMLVKRPAPVETTPEPAPAPQPFREHARPVAESTRLITYRPGRAADAARALMAAKAEAATAQSEPDQASRAADLAARVASLVSRSTTHAEPAAPRAPADSRRFEQRTTNLADRAESIRRTAARMAANAARGRVGARRPDRDSGITTRGNRTT
jgi:hypothetical protein